MSSEMITSLLTRIGAPDLLEILSQRLSASELNSLLLEVFHQKITKISPTDLFKSYQQNRFVTPVQHDWLPFLAQELQVLQFIKNQGFTPLELSPVSPLGTCSVVGTVHQHKVLSALRGTEVVADATNVLALESAVRRRQLLQKDQKSVERVRLCTTHRHVRTATIRVKGFTPHFKILCLTTAGRDTGRFRFETENILEHLQLHLQCLTDQYDLPWSAICLLFKNLHVEGVNPTFTAIHDFLRAQLPGIAIQVEDIPQADANYYQHFQFKILLRVKDQTYDIGDGGLVNWTQQLLGNRKERFLISAIGTEFLQRLQHEF